ncbi:hypothetical protein X975_26092, partial [Stegodyphus mimosarum]
MEYHLSEFLQVQLDDKWNFELVCNIVYMHPLLYHTNKNANQEFHKKERTRHLCTCPYLSRESHQVEEMMMGNLEILQSKKLLFCKHLVEILYRLFLDEPTDNYGSKVHFCH